MICAQMLSTQASCFCSKMTRLKTFFSSHAIASYLRFGQVNNILQTNLEVEYSNPCHLDPGRLKFIHIVKNNFQWGATVAQWIYCDFHLAALGSNLKHNIYTFINLSLNANCNVFKRQKYIEKEAGIGPLKIFSNFRCTFLGRFAQS